MTAHLDPPAIELRSMRVDVLRAAVTDGIAMSFAPLSERTMVIVTLTSTDGVEGKGESWANFPSWVPAERVATLTEGIVPLLREHPAGTPAKIYELLDTKLSPLGRQWGAPGPIAQAISGVDVAMWDLCARSATSPITPQPVQTWVAAYASSLGPTGHNEQAERLLAAGHHSLKVKIGFGVQSDADALSRIRKVVGDDVRIFADANQRWSLDEAISMVPILREHGVSWVEEPIAGDRLEDLIKLHERTGFPIATGENVYGVDDFERRAKSGALELLQPDVSKVGGLTPAIAIANAAAAAGCVVAPHLYNGSLAYAATLQLAAMNSAVQLIETDIRENPFRDALLLNPPTMINGWVEIPNGLGIGVETDEQRIQNYLVSSTELALS